jgi:hypothetical protein
MDVYEANPAIVNEFIADYNKTLPIGHIDVCR